MEASYRQARNSQTDVSCTKLSKDIRLSALQPFILFSLLISLQLTHLIGILLPGSETHDSHILLIPLFFPPLPVSGFVLDLSVRFLVCNTVCVCVCLFCGLGPDVFLISVDERAKHDQQFHSLSPTAGGYITGNYHSLFLFPLSPHCTPLYGQGDMRTGTRTVSLKVLSALMRESELPDSNDDRHHQSGFMLLSACQSYLSSVSLCCPTISPIYKRKKSTFESDKEPFIS